MAIREGFDLSSVSFNRSVEEEKATSDNPLSEVQFLGAPKAQEDVQVDGPVMQAYDAPWYEDMTDWLKGFKANLTHGDTFAMLHNAWKDIFNPRQAVPVKDASGQMTGTRLETPEERRERMQRDKIIAQKVYHLDPESSEAMAAKVASIFIDPTTYTIPMGKTLLQAGAIGGTVSGLDSMAYQMASEGKIDPQDTGIAVAFGTVLGPAAKLIVDKAIPLYKAFRAGGQTHEEAMARTMKALPAPDQPKLLPAPAAPVEDVSQRLLPAPAERKLIENEKRLALPHPKDSTGVHYVSETGRPARLQPESRGATEAPRKIKDRVDWEAARIEGEEASLKGAKRTPSGYEFNGYELNKVGNTWRFKPLGEDAWTDAAGTLKEAKATINKYNAQQRHIAQAEATAKAEEEAIEKVRNNFNQGGGISQTLMYHMASTGLGSAIGGAIDGKEGALYGAAAGMGAPTAWRHLISKPIGMLNAWSKTDAAGAFARGKFASSPTATLRRHGPNGERMANMLEEFHRNVDQAIGGKVFRFDKKFGHLSDKEMDNVRGLLDHTIAPKDATRTERAAASLMRREMDEVLDDAVDAGILSRRKADKLKAKAREKGYFPREYDTALLSSKAGKEAWVKTWTEFSGGTKQMESALMSIIGDTDIVASIMKKSGGKLTRGEALDLLRIMRNRNSAKRSAHLEHTRMIDESAEDILRPFLTKNPRSVMLHYFDDTYRRIESSKLFGAQAAPKTKKGLPYWNPDAKAEELFSLIGKENPEIGKLAENVFYTSVGDQKSKIVQAYTDLGDLEGRVLRGIGGFETGAKLGLAQTANMFQATVNGITRLLKISANPVTSMQVYGKALVRSLGKDGQEFAQRIGASIETTLMEAAGEASNMGKFGEKTLKWTGFIAAEKFQRILGSNIGKAYAEHLMDKYTLIQKGVIKGRRAQKILKAMDEVGLPTNRVATQTDIDRVGLKMSNDINFRNTPDQLPMMWQSPYGKMFTKFKSFAFHQGRFVKNNVIKPLLRGNPWPAMWYTAPAAGIGMGIDEFRRMVKGDDRELSMTERYLRGLTMVGGMGILQDTITSAYRSPEAGVASVAGPAISDAAKVIGGGARAVGDQDPSKLLQAISDMFVIPGKGYLVDEIASEGKKRGGSRGSSRGGSRSGAR